MRRESGQAAPASSRSRHVRRSRPGLRASIKIENEDPPFERAVHHRNAAARTETDVLAAVLAAGEHRRLPPLEALFEQVTQGTPVLDRGAEALAMRRIDHHQAGA